MRQILVNSIILMSVVVFAPSRLSAEEAKNVSLPRYRLEPGMCLFFKELHVESYFSGEKVDKRLVTEESKYRWVISMLGKNPDGGVRIIIERTKYKEKDKDDPSGETQVGYIDLQTNGRFDANESIGPRLDLTRILPILPIDAKHQASGWNVEDKENARTIKYSTTKSENGKAKFAADYETIYDPIYDCTRNSTYSFDLERGVVDSSIIKWKQGWGHESESTTTIQLERYGDLEEGEFSQLEDEMKVYFTATKKYLAKLRGDEMQDVEKCKKQCREALDILQEAKKDVNFWAFKTSLERSIEEFPSEEKYLVRNAESISKVLNQTAADWEFEDLEGKKHALKDYRGKVVVLDFWYRGCGWCIRAMPQLIKVADHYKDKPVVMFGMNRDEEKANTQHVVDTMKLNYTTLRTSELPASNYSSGAAPTLVIIDQKGIVRFHHAGYSPDLYESMVKKIDELLKN